VLSVTHRSYCAENDGAEPNERLEFLGDAVLGMVVTAHLYESFPDRPEGELAPMRAAVVNAEVLAQVAAEIDLGAALRLGKGEDAAGGRARGSILSDAVEALIGAVYLDGGWEPARRLVLDLVADRIEILDAHGARQDHKTHLQELAARQFGAVLPEYTVDSSGPDHAKHFDAVVNVAGREWGRGAGRSKKQAEQAAAAAAIAALAPALGATTDEGRTTTDA
jgi:ribonuclease III